MFVVICTKRSNSKIEEILPNLNFVSINRYEEWTALRSGCSLPLALIKPAWWSRT